MCDPFFWQMDLEGCEYHALRSSRLFFTLYNVQYILMEWTFIRSAVHHADWLCDYLRSLGYEPSNALQHPAFKKNWRTWKGIAQVLWRRSTEVKAVS